MVPLHVGHVCTVSYKNFGRNSGQRKRLSHTPRESVLNQITQIVNRAPEIGSYVDTLD